MAEEKTRSIWERMTGTGKEKEHPRDKQIREAVEGKAPPPPPVQNPSKGVDKGELGKKWEDEFHF
jgi:hypothetical protein